MDGAGRRSSVDEQLRRVADERQRRQRQERRGAQACVREGLVGLLQLPPHSACFEPRAPKHRPGCKQEAAEVCCRRAHQGPCARPRPAHRLPGRLRLSLLERGGRRHRRRVSRARRALAAARAAAAGKRRFGQGASVKRAAGAAHLPPAAHVPVVLPAQSGTTEWRAVGSGPQPPEPPVRPAHCGAEGAAGPVRLRHPCRARLARLLPPHGPAGASAARARAGAPRGHAPQR
mmetsp:Transcript_53782/g.156824  ORF Transcript_53782/g.156824 Transcript_53782/m.156824 type:complete len:232 (+) Transcript_53782:1934-2629(+)